MKVTITFDPPEGHDKDDTDIMVGNLVEEVETWGYNVKVEVDE